MPWFSGFGTSLTSATSIANPFTQIVTSTTSSLCQPIVWIDTTAGWQTMYAHQQMMSQAQAQQALLLYQQAVNAAHQQQTSFTRRLVQQQLYNPPQRPASPEVQRVVEERRTAQEEARARSRALLLEHLTPAQRKTFEENHWFVVKGGRTKRRYRINTRGTLVANVERLDSAGTRVVRLCAHCSYDIPVYDHYLTQKIMIENAEDDFLRVANRHP